MQDRDHSKDLPLVANTKDILVRHYNFNLSCSFENKTFNGSVVLFLEPVGNLCSVAFEHLCTHRNDSSDLPKNSNFDTCLCHEKHTQTSAKQGAVRYYLDSSITSNVKDSNDSSNSEYACECEEQVCCSKETLKNNKCNLDERGTHAEFKCIFDCQDIIITQVEEINVKSEIYNEGQSPCTDNILSSHEKLNFTVDEWSVRIWKENIYCPFSFPKEIKIYYETKPEGSSLLWVKDQDGNDAVYTYGAWINNRSLFPCQEPPVAMATWEATICVNKPAIVLMSGDAEPIISTHKGLRLFYYYTKMTLPLSTLALAVGFWQCHHISEGKSTHVQIGTDVPCRIFAAPSILPKAIKEFSHYIKQCLNSSQSIFGLYPFPRIDMLIVPRGFGSLGMASPNIIFLSQSLLSGDGSMCQRVAHEVAHAWFGLLIGALDWTEEWLSEGFATFMEDIIHSRAICLTSEEEKEFVEVREFLRLKILRAETENIDAELQTLRPNQGEIMKKDLDGAEVMIVKNGQNPEKGFIQVHYIKGYFLLKYLSSFVGLAQFLDLLKIYVESYKGQLVESKEIFNFYFKTFPEVTSSDKSITKDDIFYKWLDNPGLPEEIGSFHPSASNNLYAEAVIEMNKWKRMNSCLKRRKSKKKKLSFDHFKPLKPEQILLVLESLLDEFKIAPGIMKNLECVYNLQNANADIRHRWCELIVKHKYKSGYSSLKQFLKEDLAMGVYLYGELLHSNNPLQRSLAEECFKEMKGEMEPNFSFTVQQMINGSF